jgi:hypothetical protein
MTTGDRSNPYWAASGRRDFVDPEALRSGNFICENAFEQRREGQAKHGSDDDVFHYFGGLFH